MPLPDNMTKLTVVISHDEEKQIERAMDVVSQNLQEPASLQTTLATAVSFYLEKKDPLEKAKRATSSRTPKPKSPPKRGQRVKIAQVAHQVNLRDGFRCNYVYRDGTRCDKQRFLEHHHVVPVSLGGENTLENLVTRCFWHHRLEHFR